MMGTESRSKESIGGKLRTLAIGIVAPFCLFAVLMICLLISYSSRQANITKNIVTASQFNQNFKDDVDLKMYLVVSGSSSELPISEVSEARELAGKLLEGTKDKESRRLITQVINLCNNLEKCVYEIRDTEGYDDRIHQLETNIYVITRLIKEDLYKYLYIEARELAEIQTRLQKALIVSVVLAVITVAVITVASVTRAMKISKSITKPIDELYARVIDIGKGNLESESPVAAEDEKLQTLSSGLEEMVLQLKNLMDINRQEQTKRREMEFALIQAQINPHFLYNTLDTIVWLIETDQNREAQEVVSSLSTYFRSFLSNGKEIVTLKEELQHVGSYLEIQQVRYKDILNYSISSDEKYDECIIPKMTLQPIVENAIYHGIKEKRGGGEIVISVKDKDDKVCITVTDSGIGMNGEKLEEVRNLLDYESSGFGMTAVYRRLLMLFGEDCRFTVNSDPGSGTSIEIIIPHIREGEGEQ